MRGGADRFHISRKAIAKHGVITGCPGCNETARRGQRPGTFIYRISNRCRDRIVEMMKGDPEYRRLLETNWFTMGLCNIGVLIEDQTREKTHQVQKAIVGMTMKLGQQHHGCKDAQLINVMRIRMLEQMDVAEVYSQFRVAQVAEQVRARGRVEHRFDDV